MSIPCLIFANKIDRMGARYDSLLDDIRSRLTPTIAPLGSCNYIGQPTASFSLFDRFPETVRAGLIEVLADNDEDILRRFVDHGPNIEEGLIRRALICQTRRGFIHPILFGSAITGAGIKDLLEAIAEFLPSAHPETHAALSGKVFKIERGPSGEKICYAKVVSGTVRARDRIKVGGIDQRVTAIQVFENGSTVACNKVEAGRVAKLRGLTDARIGDSLGKHDTSSSELRFSPPMMETTISARDPKEKGRLFTTLSQLAEQDPFISLRVDDKAGALHVSLYGEVQREVIEETLTTEYKLKVDFSETSIIHVERPAGTGEALDEAPDPFVATIGLTVEPRPVDAGNVFELAVEPGLLPAGFFKAVEDAVMETLRQGLYGWQVIDCKVTMTKTIRYRDWANSTAADHRKLAPLVVMDALREAGSKVHEPIQNFHLECPSDSLGALISEMSKLRAVPNEPTVRGAICSLEGTIPASKVRELQLLLPGLTRGEGFLDTDFSHYAPVIGDYPVRLRTDNNPLDRKVYLRLID